MQLKELKQIADINGVIVKPEKRDKKIILNRIYNNNFVEISLYANVWQINDYKNYKKLKAKIDIGYENIDKIKYNDLKNILLSKIFEQVIKKNIMML